MSQDAAEDRDVKVHRASVRLFTTFKQALAKLLYEDGDIVLEPLRKDGTPRAFRREVSLKEVDKAISVVSARVLLVLVRLHSLYIVLYMRWGQWPAYISPRLPPSVTDRTFPRVPAVSRSPPCQHPHSRQQCPPGLLLCDISGSGSPALKRSPNAG